jgi:hypothetical protein
MHTWNIAGDEARRVQEEVTSRVSTDVPRARSG